MDSYIVSLFQRVLFVIYNYSSRLVVKKSLQPVSLNVHETVAPPGYLLAQFPQSSYNCLCMLKKKTIKTLKKKHTVTVKSNGNLFPWVPDLKGPSKNSIPVISNP